MSHLFQQAAPIPFHTLAAIMALLLGAGQLFMKKGTPAHTRIGWVWAGLILTVSISSFFIHELRLWGLYSPIHILSLCTIFSLGVAVYFARKGNIKQHKIWMMSLYFLALFVTGLFTLLPGRVMHQVLFGQAGA